MINRFGKHIEADEVFEAWTSGDLDRMLVATSLPTNAVDRYHLLQVLIGQIYRLRAEPTRRADLFSYGKVFLAELPQLMAQRQRHDAAVTRALQVDEEGRAKRDGRPVREFDTSPKTYHIEVFDQLMRAYCEDERYEDARAVARRAGKVGYADDEGVEYLLEGIEKRRRRNEKAQAARTKP